MALIEGVGDEVTFVLGSFIIIVILLLAWISTHTVDIPLIREIVVELRMRSRTRQIRTEQPQEVEISQNSREGIPSPNQENRSDASNFAEVIPEEPSNSTLRSDSELLSSASSLSGSSADFSASTQGKSPLTSNNTSETVTVSSAKATVVTNQSEHKEEEDEQIVEGSSTSTENQNFVDGASSESVSTIPEFAGETETKEETLRRRRVQYFQSGVPTSLPSDILSSDDCPRALEGLSNNTDNSKQNNAPPPPPPLHSDISDCDKKEPVVPIEGLEQPSRLDDPPQHTSNNSGPPLTSQPSRTGQEEVPEGEGAGGSKIRVKLKYMNETQKFVYASPADTIGDFRRANFQSELQDNKWIRFIFNGQDLRDDARTLQACNIENNCTMHCLVTARIRPGDRREAVVEDEEESMLGTMMYPLFTLLLLIVWYFRIFYRQYFSAMSTVCLLGISFLLVLSYVSSFRSSAESATATATNSSTQQQPTPGQASTAGGPTNHPHSD